MSDELEDDEFTDMVGELSGVLSDIIDGNSRSNFPALQDYLENFDTEYNGD